MEVSLTFVSDSKICYKILHMTMQKYLRQLQWQDWKNKFPFEFESWNKNTIEIVWWLAASSTRGVPLSLGHMICHFGIWAHLTKSYEVTIRRYRYSHAKIEDMFCSV